MAGIREIQFDAGGACVLGHGRGLFAATHLGEQPDLLGGPLGLVAIKPRRQGRDLALGLLGLGTRHRQPGGELRGALLGLGELPAQPHGLGRERLDVLGVRRHRVVGLARLLGPGEGLLEHPHPVTGDSGLPLGGGDPLFGLGRLPLGGGQPGRERRLLQQPLVPLMIVPPMIVLLAIVPLVIIRLVVVPLAR